MPKEVRHEKRIDSIFYSMQISQIIFLKYLACLSIQSEACFFKNTLILFINA